MLQRFQSSRKVARKPNSQLLRSSLYACEALERRLLLALVAPVFHSHPGAPATLYLNFVGSPAFDWGGTRAHGAGSNDAPIPGFTTDSDANNFSQTEINAIASIFGIVAEKFSPFNLDVTTQDPGNRTHGVTITDHIGGSNSDWYGKGGGVSQIGSFTNTDLVPDIFAWSGDLNWTPNADPLSNGSTFSIDFLGGNTIPHEAGHAFGLEHQRTPGAAGQPLNEYYNGDATRSPIMGNSANGDNASKRGIWWLTNMEAGQQSPDPIQNDLAVISGANNGFGYRPDDWSYANYFTMPVAPDGSLGPVNGLIENTSDVDPFRFAAIGSTGTFKITSVLSAAGGGMLEPSGRLVDAITHQPIPFNIVVSGTTATLSSSSMVPGHDYFVEVRSFGGYCDIGQYFVSGNLQGFASYNPSTRAVTVGGLGGNNNVTLSTSGNTLIVQDSLNGGATATQNFVLSAVDSVSVDLGGGDDKLNCVGLNKAGGSALPVFIFMGGGFDTLNLGGGSTFLTFTVNTTVIDVSFANGVRFAQFWNYDAERVEIHGTTSSSDVFNINSLNSYSDIYAYGDAGDDKLVVSPEVVGVTSRTVIFYGGAGTDTLELNGSTLGFDQSFNLFGNAIQRFLPSSPFASEVQFDNTTEIFNIKGGSGNDTFQILTVPAGTTVNATGNAGDDTFRFGKSNQPHPFELPFSANIFGTIIVNAGTGTDLVYVDDVAWNGGLSPSFSIGSTFLSGGVLTQATVNFDSSLEKLEFHASDTRAGQVTLFGIPASPMLSLFGGAGNSDVLIVDDRNLQVIPLRVDLDTDSYKEYYGAPQSPTIRQLSPISGFEQFKLYTHNITNAINVIGVPAGRSTTIFGGSNADTVTVYPHDALGNLTINADLVVSPGGGSDTVVIDDTASSNPINYTFTNTFGGLIDQIAGLGTGKFAPFADVENVIIKGGDGNDTFNFTSHKLNTGVAIYGGGGDDVLNFGGGNLAVNIASLPSFLFDGQGGFNTFNLLDVNDSTGDYARNFGAVSYFNGAGTYNITVAEANTQLMQIYPSSDGPSVNMVGVAPGTTTAVHFDTPVNLGLLRFGVGSKMLLGIQGAVIFDGGINGSSISVLNGLDPTGPTVHLTQNTLGAFPGDDLFPSGGSLTFTNIKEGSNAGLNLSLGAGADTLYVEPNLTGTINVTGGSPTSAPGDQLNLALANAQNYVLNGTALSGSVTSSNLKTLSYSGFEGDVSFDDVAPVVAAANFNIDGAPPALRANRTARIAATLGLSSGGPSLDIQFSENVALLKGTASILLTNLTTGAVVPQAFLAMTYDATAQIAHFTFPGYPNGTPPDGNYVGSIPANSTEDLFGNPLATDASFNFFILAGDANHDRHVDEADLAILNAHLGQAGPSTFSQGDFNYDDSIDAADTAILNGNLHVWLPPQGNLSVSFPAGDASFRLKAESSSLLDLFTTAAPTPTYRILIGAVTGLTFSTIAGDTGNDTLTLDFSNGNPLPASGLTFDGGAGINTLAIIGTPGNDTLTANGTALLFTGGTFSNIPLTTANVKSLQFKGGSGGADSINLTGGTYKIDADTPTGTPNVSVTVGPTAVATFDTDQHLANLTLDGGSASLSSVRHSMTLNGLSIVSGGLLDIANSFLYINNTALPLATVKSYLDAAYNLNGPANPNTPLAGDYAGLSGITSSLAKTSYADDLVIGIGFYDGALQDPINPDSVGQLLGPDSDSGHGTGIPLNQILIRPTLTGDLNGDGVVNAYDVSLFNSYGLFNSDPTPLGWQAGDLNGDGLVNAKDVTIFNTVGNFNQPPLPVPTPIKAAAKTATVTSTTTPINASIFALPSSTPTARPPSTPPSARRVIHHSVRKAIHAALRKIRPARAVRLGDLKLKD